MNIRQTLSNIRSHLAEKLSALLNSPKRTFLGVREIPVEQIAGTSTRHRDFDPRFRPLGYHLQNRSIVLHKVGDQYFVKNGHYRVSVARYHGKKSICAKVWEYQLPQKSAMPCEQGQCRKGSAKKDVCVAG